MAAALALPGLAAADEGDTVDFQYSRYEEGHRRIYGVEKNEKTLSTNLKSLPYRNPLTVDSLHGAARVSLTDRLSFGFNYLQDTWGGATPISTAPAAFGQNRERAHTASGASPLINAPSEGDPMLFDRQLRPLRVSGFSRATGKYRTVEEPTLTHVLATASPETRKQGDFRLGYRWDEAELSAGGGLSVENDYDSRFVNLGGRMDFNRKLTTVDLGLSYTSSDTHAILDPNARAYMRYYNYAAQIENVWVPDVSKNFKKLGNIQSILTGSRRDWAASLSLTQVLSQSALVQAGFGYTRSSGYLANPYKLVETYWVDPNQAPDPALPAGVLTTTGNNAQAFLERRPEQRHQWTGDLRYVQHVAPLDAALHLNYRFFHDDWGIDAHTFEADWVQPLGGGWTLTPRARYYSQSAADFYHPYLVVPYAYDAQNAPQQPDRTAKAYAKNLSRLPAAYSSDHRLSAYGAFSWGVTLSKRFRRGVSLEAGFEHYTHGGGLRLGGGGEADFADFDYWVANAALRVDLSAPGVPGDEGHTHAHHHHGADAPAGVMFAHMLEEPGALMAGYRYMYGRQAGALLHGGEPASMAQVIRGGCPPLARGCLLSPQYMDMHMHMVELMYAPTSWLNLMLMPQFVDMEMQMGNQLRTIRDTGSSPDPERFETGIVDNTTTMAIGMHKFFTHATGGIGDTGLYAMAKLWRGENQGLHLTAGVTAPTGSINRRMRLMHQEKAAFLNPKGSTAKYGTVDLPERLYDYGMQLGSGTWDFKPSLTYTGMAGGFSWGAQAAATVRLEERNDLGYALGDVFQATAWAGYSPLHWMTLTARGLYTTQGAIRGGFKKIHEEGMPTDYPDNYGGRYWDAGFGLNLLVPSGTFAGNRVSVEWLQPMFDDPNGYQLKRQGSLSATWSLAF